MPHLFTSSHGQKQQLWTKQSITSFGKIKQVHMKHQNMFILTDGKRTKKKTSLKQMAFALQNSCCKLAACFVTLLKVTDLRLWCRLEP